MNYTRILFIFGLIALLAAGCGEDYTEDYPVPDASVVAKFAVDHSDLFDKPDTATFSNQSIIPATAGTPSYLWEFGDGGTSTEENPTHVYKQYGTYEAQLTVTTNQGHESEYSEFFEVMEVGDTVYVADFEGLALMPEDIKLVNVDGNTPSSAFSETYADSAWAVRYSSAFQSNIAEAISYYDPEAGADDWMILPATPVGDSAVVRWRAMSLTGSGDYPDGYEVYVSTTEQTIDGALENKIFSIEAESWGTDATNPGEGMKNRAVSLNTLGIANQEIYLAFRLNTPSPGGSSLGVDDIVILDY